MFKKIDHIEIIPHDMEATISFYTGVLGFTIKSRNSVGTGPLKEVVFLELNGTMVELMKVENPVPLAELEWQIGYRALALEVTDMDEVIHYLAEKNVSITWGPVTMGTTKRAEIKDPNGLTIELRQW